MPKKISINRDISIAKTLPSDFYLDKTFYELSIERIFKKSWQLITHKKNLINNIYPFTFLEGSVNEPLVITSDNNNIYCLSNVCTHRGNILCSKPCLSKNIQCNYHGRIFKLDGIMKSMPGFNEVKNFPTDDDNLKNFDVISWKDFIMVSLKKKFDLTEVFGDIENRLSWYPFDELIYNEKDSNSYLIDANWALYCENYLEGFHVPFVHKGLHEEIDFNSYKTVLLNNGVLQYTYSQSNQDVLKIPGSNKYIYAYYYWIFPNIMLNFYSWGLSINIIEPLGIDKIKISFLSYPIKDKSQPQNTNSSLDVVENEDQMIVQSVQRGIRSNYYNRGRYSAKYEKGVHHFHRLISKYL